MEFHPAGGYPTVLAPLWCTGPLSHESSCALSLFNYIWGCHTLRGRFQWHGRCFFLDGADTGGEGTEDFEVMMQGVNGVVFLRERRLKIKFTLRRSRGSLAFYNTSKGEASEVHFSNVMVTNLSKSAPELSGMLASREKAVLEMDKEPVQLPKHEEFDGIREEGELEP